MKKANLFMFLFLLGFYSNASSQSAPVADFFAGKWEILIMGTPDGDAKMNAILVRKDGKLTGELVSAGGDGSKEPIVITQIEEGSDKVNLFFTAQGYDVNLELTKVDEDHLKGQLMNMFDATAVRVKN